MAILSIRQLQDLASSAGFPDSAVSTAAAVAMAESGGNTEAVGDNGDSCGLWQVNTPSHPQYTCSQLLDPNFNAQAALSISKGGVDWTPWTTYRTGAYSKWVAPFSNRISGLEALGIGVALVGLAGALAYASTVPRRRRPAVLRWLPA